MTNLKSSLNNLNESEILTYLEKEVFQKKSLEIIENALWSMNGLIVENEDINSALKANFSDTFNLAIYHFERLKAILEIAVQK